MRWFGFAVLYTALALGANAALAEAVPPADLREGTMLKLNFHAEAKAVPLEAPLKGLDDTDRSLAEFQGKLVVLNFWATWCAPCRKEMPALDALQAEFGGDGFAVVTVAVGRQSVPAIKRFFGETGVEHVHALRDPQQALAREMGVLGLPITVILNPEGQEIARMQGDAEWNGDSARAIIQALLPQG